MRVDLVPCQEDHGEEPSLVSPCPFQVDGRIVVIVGYHWIAGTIWHCLLDLRTREHFDVQFAPFDAALQDPEDDRVVKVPEMVALAYASK